MIITHTDLDGFVSALLAMETSGQPASAVHGFSYESDRDAQWKRLLTPFPTESVWFVDISLTPGELEWARGNIRGKKSPLDWLWYDHHESSRAFDPRCIFNTVSLVTEDSIENKCAADLVAERYTVNPAKFGWLGEWVAAAHDRDLWINEHRERGMKLTMIISDANRRGAKNSAGLRDLLSQVQDGMLSPDDVVQLHSAWWQAGWRQYENSCQIAKRTALRRTVGDLTLVRWMTNEYQLVIRLKHGSPSDAVIQRCIDMVLSDGWEITTQHAFGKNWCVDARRTTGEEGHGE